MRKQLENLNIANVEIERIEERLNNITLNEDRVKDLYSDTSIRRTMKANGLWNSGNAENFESRYLGAGIVEVKNINVWANYDKVRVYYDVVIDGITLKEYIVVDTEAIDEVETVEEVAENNFDELIEELKDSVEVAVKKEESKEKYRRIIEEEVIPFFENKTTTETDQLEKAYEFVTMIHENFKITLKVRNHVLNKFREEDF